MKNFLICLLMTSFVASMSFAEDAETECPAMRESTERNNPKANTVRTQKPTAKPSGVIRQ
jgi:hypothetical protein